MFDAAVAALVSQARAVFHGVGGVAVERAQCRLGENSVDEPPVQGSEPADLRACDDPHMCTTSQHTMTT